MNKLLRPMFFAALAIGVVACASAVVVRQTAKSAEDKPDVGPSPAAQSAADLLRTYAGADGAFIHAGFLKDTYTKEDLATWLKYPVDEIVTLSLTGDQVRQAFELSVSLYPESNMSFLQISGFEVTFKKTGPTDHRIVSITANGANLDNAKTYTVAMPSLLAHGAVGYYRIWGKAKPTKEFPNVTMESVLKGKKPTAGSLRWTAQS
jgi:2',3'-cyclic-nucleotide 2'-phosphodiesterase (5'-nucleotidase family)